MQKNLKINDFISDLADLEYSIEENKSKFIFTNKDEVDNLLPPIQSSVIWAALDNKNCLKLICKLKRIYYKNNNIILKRLL